MPRATKKHLGCKKPSKTRKNRKPLKKNKRRNMKKGGFLNMNTPFTTFDYSERVTPEQVVYVVETLLNAKGNKRNLKIFDEVPYDSTNPNDINLRISNNAVKNYLDDYKNTVLPLNEFKKVFNQMMKEFDKNQEPEEIWKDTFKINPVKDDIERLRCVINTALHKDAICKTTILGRDLKYPTLSNLPSS